MQCARSQLQLEFFSILNCVSHFKKSALHVYFNANEGKIASCKAGKPKPFLFFLSFVCVWIIYEVKWMKTSIVSQNWRHFFLMNFWKLKCFSRCVWLFLLLISWNSDILFFSRYMRASYWDFVFCSWKAVTHSKNYSLNRMIAFLHYNIGKLSVHRIKQLMPSIYLESFDSACVHICLYLNTYNVYAISHRANQSA